MNPGTSNEKISQDPKNHRPDEAPDKAPNSRTFGNDAPVEDPKRRQDPDRYEVAPDEEIASPVQDLEEEKMTDFAAETHARRPM